MTRVAVGQLEGRPLAEAAAALDACGRLVADAARAGADVVVLPEGAYPAYVLGSADAARAALAAGPDPLEAFGAMARAGGLTLVAGIVLDGGHRRAPGVDSAGGLLNAAVAFGPDGSVLGSTAKRFLWHFDSCWFSAGDDSPVWTSAAGRLGALVCADARLPEIARLLAVRGAGLVCDPTAWVTPRPGAPSNIQPEFLLAARAAENGVVVAAASKCGFEGDAVAYTGRSMIVGPGGDVLAEAGTEEGIVVADVDLAGLPRPPVARRPELYGRLAAPDLGPAPGPTATRVRVAAANSPDAARPDRLAALSRHGVSLVAVPPGAGDVAGLARDSGLWVAGPEAVASPVAGVVARFPRAHGAEATAQSLAPPAPTPVGRVAVLSGVDVAVPEQARVAALEGAEVLVVCSGWAPLAMLRARAAENRVFVVAAVPGRTVVVAPSGVILADAPADRPFLCAADLFLPEAADKAMAPGTDVFAGRCPDAYRELTSDV